MQNLDVACSICGKKHWGKTCYKVSEACFGCGKHGHMIQDCLENKKFIIGKPKEENKEDKHKPRIQGRMFSMTHQDAQATSDVATGIIRIYILLLESRALINLTQHTLCFNIFCWFVWYACW